jgi:hypothetical protein
LNKGYITAGIVMAFVGIMLISVGIALGDSIIAAPPTLIGVSFLWLGVPLSIGGLFSKPAPRSGTKREAFSSLRMLSFASLGLGGIMAGIAIVFVLEREYPILLGIAALLFIGYFLLVNFLSPLLMAAFSVLGFVYSQVKPKTALSKAITALISVAFGVFWLYIFMVASGGIYGLITPFFFNPLGFVILLVLGFVFLFLGIIVAELVQTFLARALEQFHEKITSIPAISNIPKVFVTKFPSVRLEAIKDIENLRKIKDAVLWLKKQPVRPRT